MADACQLPGPARKVMPCARASALDTGPIKNIVVSSVLIICRAVCWGARSSWLQYRKKQKPWQPSFFSVWCNSDRIMETVGNRQKTFAFLSYFLLLFGIFMHFRDNVVHLFRISAKKGVVSK